LGLALSDASIARTITVNVASGADFTSIQDAIADAGTVDGDEIQVAPGTYHEAIDFLGKAVRLYSAGGPEVTIINGAGHYHVVQCISNEDPNTILQGFTITGGDANSVSWPDCHGGGMLNISSRTTIAVCIFTGNSANDIGGDMCNSHSSEPAVTSCIFTGSAVIGGGMANYQSSPTVTNCIFTADAIIGGGMANQDADPTVISCIFTGNSAAYGGGMSNQNSSPIVVNCSFTENSAAYEGGGMSSDYTSSPAVTNCLFKDDTADTGGGMYSAGSGSPIVTNCIIRDNTASTDPQIHGVGAIVTCSNVEGGWSGTGNIDADPNFVNAHIGQFRLSIGSPCIDAGRNLALPTTIVTDLAGNPRIIDGDANGTTIVDMGPYEFDITAFPYNVTHDRFLPTIQAAIIDANAGDEIRVPPGRFYETVNFIGKAVRLYSSSGPEVTTIDGTGHSHVVQCIANEGPDTVLEGFTITGGNTDSGGGGMYNDGSSPTVTHCVFTGNVATYNGGAMYNIWLCSPAVTGCIFRGNSAKYGGGMANYYSSCPTVTNCIFAGNSASEDGGAMYNFNRCEPIVTNCTFVGNTAADQGGGIYDTSTSGSTVINSILWDNHSNQFYGDSGSSLTVTYSDIQGGWSGTGNINADPNFVDAGSGDLYLRSGSPCIDAGDSTAVPGIVTSDLNGWSRFLDDLCKSDTGSGPAPIVDIGAYEFMPADIDGSQAVDFGDYASLATHWQEAGGDCGHVDMNCDGFVNMEDLGVLVTCWLEGI